MSVILDKRQGALLVWMVLLAGFMVFPATASTTTMFHMVPWHSGDYSGWGETLPNELLLWAFQTSGMVESSPVFADEVVYVGSSDGIVYAINAITGSQKWAYDTGSVVVTTPAVGFWGMVYVGGADGKVYALDRETGAQLWAVTPSQGGYECGTPTLGLGAVYIGCLDNNLYALSRDYGQEIWRYQTEDYVRSSPAVAFLESKGKYLVYVGSNDGNVYALGAEFGTLEWTFTTGSPVASSPAVMNGIVYVGNLAGDVYALDAATGTQKWVYPTGGAIVYGSPAVADGRVFIGNFDGYLYALDALTGDLDWRFPTGGIVAGSPAFADGVVYIGTDMGNAPSNLYAVDAETGAQRWAFTAGNGVVSTPSMAYGVVYVGSLDGNVYAIGVHPPVPPVFTGMSPPAGAWGEDPYIEITGAYFTSGTTVTFSQDGSADMSLQVITAMPTAITGSIVITPGTATGLWDIRIISPYGETTALGAFTVVEVPAMEIEARCPVDLVVKDSVGRVITKASNEIPDAAYWEEDLDNDGSPDARVVILDPSGDYQISVVKKSDADPADTYTLTVTNGEGVMVTLAEEVAVSNIYRGPYRIQVTETGDVERIAYSWSGYLSPFSTGGKPTTYKKGVVIPVKFRLTGESSGITDAIAQLYYAQVAHESTYYPATPVHGADNRFRYDPNLDQYIFNWNTGGLSAGTYLLKTEMGDGMVRTVTIILGK